MTDHCNSLERINQHMPLKEKLYCAHDVISERFPFIVRIAITLYDPKTNHLKTYLHSSGDDNPLDHYEIELDSAPSLKALLEQGKPRIINNLVTQENSEHPHTQRIARQGYAASYTLPMFHNGEFIGFLFFNSNEHDVFDDKTVRDIEVYAHLITLMVINELTTLNILSAAIKTTRQITHQRDAETGSHMDRMSRYSRLIALALAESHGLDDDFIEHVFMFAPLHDIGKVGIPDEILLKPGGLDDEERNIMQTHARLGREMIEAIINNFGLDNINKVSILKNIAEFHHESWNGSGYPSGRKGEEIPLEARIVAVADVFDALTSERPYKKAWSNDEAFSMLEELAGEHLDRDCVDALLAHKEEVAYIQDRFRENPYG